MLSIEERVDNIISLLTPEEKIDVLGANYYLGRTSAPSLVDPPGDQRLQPGGRPAWAGARQAGSPNAIPTTTFIQSIGLGETWDPDLLQKAAAMEGYEARWLNQTEKYKRGGSAVPDHPRAQRGPRPRHPLGPERRVLRRGCVPERHADRRVRPRACRATIASTGKPPPC